eukprot:ANDGO_00054.mRNA.1 hypothetical protein
MGTASLDAHVQHYLGILGGSSASPLTHVIGSHLLVWPSYASRPIHIDFSSPGAPQSPKPRYLDTAGDIHTVPRIGCATVANPDDPYELLCFGGCTFPKTFDGATVSHSTKSRSNTVAHQSAFGILCSSEFNHVTIRPLSAADSPHRPAFSNSASAQNHNGDGDSSASLVLEHRHKNMKKHSQNPLSPRWAASAAGSADMHRVIIFGGEGPDLASSAYYSAQNGPGHFPSSGSALSRFVKPPNLEMSPGTSEFASASLASFSQSGVYQSVPWVLFDDTVLWDSLEREFLVCRTRNLASKDYSQWMGRRAWHSTTCLGSKMYLCGGFLTGPSSVASDMWVLDVPTLCWNRVPQPKGAISNQFPAVGSSRKDVADMVHCFAAAGHGMAALDDSFLLCHGGMMPASVPGPNAAASSVPWISSQTALYDPRANQWVPVRTVVTKVTCCDDLLVPFAGLKSINHNTVELLSNDPAARSSVSLRGAPQRDSLARWKHNLSVLDDRHIAVVGGIDNAGLSGDVSILDLAF